MVNALFSLAGDAPVKTDKPRKRCVDLVFGDTNDLSQLTSNRTGSVPSQHRYRGIRETVQVENGRKLGESEEHG